MSLSLILTRHAKSSWDDPAQDDHDRPLNARGQRAAPAIGAWLRAHDHIPAEVVSSTAKRTLETWDLIAPELGNGMLMRREPALYHAPADVMLRVLQGCAATPVLMIGHNPGIAEFAARLLATAPEHPRFAAYPTCATLVASFDAADWADVDFGTGRPVDFVVPKDLTG